MRGPAFRQYDVTRTADVRRILRLASCMSPADRKRVFRRGPAVQVPGFTRLRDRQQLRRFLSDICVAILRL